MRERPEALKIRSFVPFPIINNLEWEEMAMRAEELRSLLQSAETNERFAHIYACTPEQAAGYAARVEKALGRFEELFGTGRDLYVFSAPGRTEVGGNHTDHQRGRVLAASVNLDVIAVAALSEGTVVRVHSEGYAPDVVDISDPEPKAEEANHSASLVRGICARFAQLGCPVKGFDAYTTSSVLSGSGLSSSAAFEVLVGTMVNELFFGGRESALKIAQISQYAENRYFGKPCGLMDQAASSVGAFITIDFEDKENPRVEKIDFDFAKSGYALCITDTHGSHSDLTPDYAAVPAEMRAVAALFGKEVLREVDEEEFYRALPGLRGKVSDRALLRAAHFFGDNARVPKQVEALRRGDFDEFKRLVIESGRSSYMYLQNVYSPAHPAEQGVSLALAACERLLAPVGGAWRVHGGGFAGTVQSFVPLDFVEHFIREMDALFGAGSCHRLAIRPVGGVRLF